MDEAKLCRICGNLANAKNSENLFGRSQRALLRQIEALTGLQLQYASNLPLLICETCQVQTEQAHAFRERCIRVQQTFASAEFGAALKDYAGDVPNKSSIVFNVMEQEKVEQDVMPDMVVATERVVKEEEEIVEEEEEEVVEEDLMAEMIAEEVAEEVAIMEAVQKEEQENESFTKIEALVLKTEETVSTDTELLDDLYDLAYQDCMDEEQNEQAVEMQLPATTTITTTKINLALAPNTKKKPNAKRKVFFCEDCDRQFNSRTTFWYHRKLHDGTDKKNFMCLQCDRIFASSSSLWYHRKKHDGTYVPRKKPSSTITRKKTPRTVSLFCDQCGKHFKDGNNLKDHLIRHAGLKPHQCELCPKKFATKPEVRIHLRSHTGEQPYSCRYCEVRFKTLSSRAVHERKHTNKRPFPCVECDMAFTTSSSLKTHMLTHTDERPFECGVCNRTFTRQKHLDGHFLSKTHEKNLKKQEEIDFGISTSLADDESVFSL